MNRRMIVMVVATLALVASNASAQLIISEVYEGNGGTVKFLEIYNPGVTSVNLATGGYELERYSNANTSATSIALSGTIAAGDFFVIGQDDQSVFPVGTFDQTSTQISHNGNDKYRLVDSSGPTPVVVDGFAADNIGDDTYFAENVVAHRVSSALPNNGDWGSTTQPSSGGTSTSGAWIVTDITSGNGNALTASTPGTSGGGGGSEVPVELVGFSVE